MIKEKYLIKQTKKSRFRKFIRKTINGTADQPRIIMVRSNKYLYTQVIDDDKHEVLASASTLEKELKTKLKSTRDSEAAKLMGKIIAERLKKIKIKTVTFDRNVYPFIGRVKIFADSARENGIKF